ncbi:MAG: MFS transporter [Clostridia bacterium]|nr:MFS transporter [Clostridia bacterium]
MKKLGSKKQIALYAVSGMGVNLLNTMMTSYLCSALIIGGFGEAAIRNQTYLQRDLVDAAIWGAFVLIAKIIDGIIDVPMAALTDGLRSRFGRRRPSLLIGLIPLLLSYAAFLIVPRPEGVSLLNTFYYGVVLCIFYTCYTLTMVTYYATFTEIVSTERERTMLGNVKSVCDIVYFIIGYVGVRAMLNGMNVRVAALIVMPLSLTMLIPLFMIKEPSNRDEPKEKTKRLRLVPSLAATLKNGSFIKWMIVYSFMTFGVQLFLGGINEYFSFVKMNMIYVMMAAFAPVPLTLLLYNKIHRRYGFGVSYGYILTVFFTGTITMFFVSFMAEGAAKTVLSIISGLICSFAIGALFAVAYSVPSQLAAEEEERTGVSNSAMYFAVQGLFSGVATGIGTGVVLTALKKSSEGVADIHAGTAPIAYMTLICAAAMAVSLIFTFFLPKSIKLLGKEQGK